MKTYKLTIEYDGSGFSGWQSQPAQKTVQGVLEEGLATILRTKVALQGAGRTDAGVHALGQVASFSTDAPVECPRLCRGLTALSNYEISVIAAEEVNQDFNARFDSVGKHYRYTVQSANVPSPLLRSTAHFVPGGLDADLMRQGAQKLIGTHDFAGFRAADCERENTVREITSVTITTHDRGMYYIDVNGTAFLKNMVRILAGTLIEIGRGRLTPDSIDEILKTGDRTKAGFTAPAHGLALVEVFY